MWPAQTSSILFVHFGLQTLKVFVNFVIIILQIIFIRDYVALWNWASNQKLKHLNMSHITKTLNRNNIVQQFVPVEKVPRLPLKNAQFSELFSWRHFINCVKLCLWLILHYLDLLVNSANVNINIVPVCPSDVHVSPEATRLPSKTSTFWELLSQEGFITFFKQCLWRFPVHSGLLLNSACVLHEVLSFFVWKTLRPFVSVLYVFICI